MAFKPSLRAHNRIKEIPLDIKPVMNLMVVLIPILLYSAEFVKLSIRELNLPPSISANSGQNQENEEKKEKEKRLGLKVLVSKNGFYLANDNSILESDVVDESETGERTPTVPMVNSAYDYNTLIAKLLEIKDKIKDFDFADQNSIIISAEADIEYKHIIKLMDYVTVYEDEEGNKKELFPQINIAQVR